MVCCEEDQNSAVSEMNRRPLQRYVDNSIVIGGDGGPTASDRARFAEVVQFLAARCSVSGLELAPRQHKLNFVIVDLPRDGTFTLTKTVSKPGPWSNQPIVETETVTLNTAEIGLFVSASAPKA